MKPWTQAIEARPSKLLVGASLALVWMVFSVVHVQRFLVGGEWVYLLFCVSETLTALLFLARSAPVTVSHDPVDWVLAISATFSPMLFGPAGGALLPEARLLLPLGAALQLAALLSLNRSLGVVPARRSIKTAGMYALVRHPLYASYLLSFTAYLLTNSSSRNAAVYGASVLLLYLRMLREERHLANDVRYLQYMRDVKYRLIPLLF